MELDFLFDYLENFGFVMPDDTSELDTLSDGSVLVPLKSADDFNIIINLLKIFNKDKPVFVTIPIDPLSDNVLKIEAVKELNFIGLKVYKSFFVYHNLGTVKTFTDSNSLFNSIDDLEDTDFANYVI